MTTPPTTRSSRLSYKRPKQEKVTEFLDDGKLIVICFSEHVEINLNCFSEHVEINLNYML